jgi:transcription initiation factor TFIIIB Brf1 subunit/transcription initiation factor TFIIB
MTKIAKDTAKRIHDKSLLEGRQPLTIVAVAIQILNKRLEMPLPQLDKYKKFRREDSELANIVSRGIGTINNGRVRIKEFELDILPEEWLTREEFELKHDNYRQ